MRAAAEERAAQAAAYEAAETERIRQLEEHQAALAAEAQRLAAEAQQVRCQMSNLILLCCRADKELCDEMQRVTQHA